MANTYKVEGGFTNDLIKNLLNLVRTNIKLIWIECSTDSILKLTDIGMVVKVVKKICSEMLVAVDNTFLSPYLLNQLNFGADILVYSATK